MCDALIEKQRQRLNKEISEYQDLFAELKAADLDFRKFSNWNEVIETFRQVKWMDSRSDRILRPILQHLRRSGDRRWLDILTAMLWHMLCSIYWRMRVFADHDAEQLEDLWQGINWRFLEYLHSIDIATNDKRIALRIFIKLKNSTQYEFRKKRRDYKRCVLSEPGKIESIINSKSILNAKAISISARLSLYQRLGILKVIEYEFVESLQSGSESLAESAERLGIDYETAKKVRQRAIKKIKHLEDFLSPFGPVAPPLIGERRKHDRDADDEDSD